MGSVELITRLRLLLFPALLYKRSYFKVPNSADSVQKRRSTRIMHSNYVDIQGIPTRIITFGKWIEEPFEEHEKELILVITGNPGLPNFYVPFLSTIHSRLESSIPVWIIGHAGHDEPPGKKASEIPPLNGNEEIFELKGQLKHKMNFFETYVPKNIKIHIVGHSVGAWTILQLLKDETIKNQIEHCYLLFPTIERMKDSPAGGMFSERYEKAQMWTKLFKVLYWLPLVFRKWLVAYFVNKYNLPADYVDSAICFTNGRILERMLLMGKDQVENVAELETDVIERNKSSMTFYYGTRDHWVPTNYYHELVDRIPGINAHLDELNMAHAFNIRNGPEMGQIVAEWIKKNRSNGNYNQTILTEQNTRQKSDEISVQ